MAERRENCKKQIVSNTNHNRMPERREKWKNKKKGKRYCLKKKSHEKNQTNA
jgi:hypothetical protein